jgi:hypothetical protein
MMRDAIKSLMDLFAKLLSCVPLSDARLPIYWVTSKPARCCRMSARVMAFERQRAMHDDNTPLKVVASNVDWTFV